MRLGNCYGATEALYFLLGGKNSDWNIMKMPYENTTHWYLQHKTNNIILDITAKQFKKLPDYSLGRKSRFFPKMSNRAKFLSDVILWRDAVELAMKGL